ncbi:MAG: sarcosine oxidase subunit gamma [Marinibacterium sp.]
MAETAVFDGIARVERLGPAGMIAIRGDLSDPGMTRAIADATGIAVPEPLSATQTDAAALLWMSPDEVLLIDEGDDLPGHLGRLQRALGDRHALAVDVSDMRARFAVTGAPAREVLAKLCPIDLSPEGFTAGTVRRTRLAQIAAFVWLRQDGRFDVACLRSVADYAFDALCVAARDGTDIGVF